MRIHAGDHVDLRMACITLGGLQVAVVQFQLVGGAGMTEGMKDHSGQPCLFPQLLKLLQDDAVLAGAPIGQRHHQVKILVLVTEKSAKLILGVFPFPQPYLADTGIGLGLFQDHSCAGVGKQRRKDVVDILLPQHLNGPLGGPRQLLVDENIGVVIGNILVGDVDVVPGQAQDLAHAQRAGKGQVHRHIELAVRTLIQSGADHIGGPDVPLLVLRFGQDHIFKGVLGDQLPPYRLLEGAAQEFDDLLDGGVGDQIRLCVMGPGIHCRGFLQGLDVLVHHPRRDLLHLQISNDGVDVVGDQRVLAVVHGHAPLLFPIERNKVQKKFCDGLVAGRKEGPRELLVLHLRFALQCVLVRGAGLPFLPGLTVLVRIVVDDGIILFPFDNRCHSDTSFLSHRSSDSSHSSNDRLEIRMALPIRTILKCPSFTRR